MTRIQIEEQDLLEGDSTLRAAIANLPPPALANLPGMPPSVANQVSVVVGQTSAALEALTEELDLVAADLRRRAKLVAKANLLKAIMGPDDPSLMYLAGSTFTSIEDAEAAGKRLAELIKAEKDPKLRGKRFRHWLRLHGDDPYYTKAFLKECGPELLKYLQDPPSASDRIEFLEHLAEFPTASALFIDQGEGYMRKVIDIRNSIPDKLSSSQDWEAFDIALGKVMVSGTSVAAADDGNRAARTLFSLFGDLGDLDVEDHASWREKRGLDHIELGYDLYQEPLAKVFAANPYVMSAFLSEGNQRTGEAFLGFVLNGLNPDSVLIAARAAQKVASRPGAVPTGSVPFDGAALDPAYRNLLATVRAAFGAEARRVADDTNAQQRWIARTGGLAIGLISGPLGWAGSAAGVGAGEAIDRQIDDFDQAVDNIDRKLVRGFAVRWVSAQAIAHRDTDQTGTARKVYQELEKAQLLGADGNLIPPEKMTPQESQRLAALLKDNNSTLRWQTDAFAGNLDD